MDWLHAEGLIDLLSFLCRELQKDLFLSFNIQFKRIGMDDYFPNEEVLAGTGGESPS